MSEDLIAILLSSVLVGAGVVVARFFREASLLAAVLGFIGLELTLLLISEPVVASHAHAQAEALMANQGLLFAEVRIKSRRLLLCCRLTQPILFRRQSRSCGCSSPATGAGQMATPTIEKLQGMNHGVFTEKLVSGGCALLRA